MNSANFTVGDYVRIADCWRDSSLDGEALYVVVEDNGDRCIIELICDLPLRPQELVRREMIERV